MLFVGSHARTARVCAFDLDGRPLDGSLAFCDETRGRSSVSGLAVDVDRRLWVADGEGRCLRTFSVFGQQVAQVPGGQADVRGSLGRPSGVAVRGTDDELVVAVASAGRRRHAVQLLSPATGRSLSLRPLGDPEGRFEDVVGVELVEDEVWVLEAGRSRIQVFRGADFHYSVPLPELGDARPAAFALAPGGRPIVAWEGERGAVLALDREGAIEGCLAAFGEDEGSVAYPTGLVCVPGEDDRHTRVVLLDRDGRRVQVFNLEGTCYGAFARGEAGSA